MALIELYRITGDKRHTSIWPATFCTATSGLQLRPERDHLHVLRNSVHLANQAGGHAVRAMYACCGATDYYLETGDPAYWKTLNTLWEDLTATKMYVTGGVGARADGEAFGDAYELPNARAYGESCAAIGNMMWNWRMLAASGEARFTDVIERALYNGINSGMSLDGTLYCYRNPLAFDPGRTGRSRSAIRGTTRPAARRTWSAPSPRCRAISTAPAATAFTCTSTTTRNWTGIWKMASA